jgi:hypothetical protein
MIKMKLFNRKSELAACRNGQRLDALSGGSKKGKMRDLQTSPAVAGLMRERRYLIAQAPQGPAGLL